MKFVEYLKKRLHPKHPLLRLNKNFIEITPKELDDICKCLIIKELLHEPLNPLERLGVDLLLGSVGVDSDNKEAVRSLYEYLAKN